MKLYIVIDNESQDAESLDSVHLSENDANQAVKSAQEMAVYGRSMSIAEYDLKIDKYTDLDIEEISKEIKVVSALRPIDDKDVFRRMRLDLIKSLQIQKALIAEVAIFQSLQKFTNGRFSIEWEDSDVVKIFDESNGRVARMQGGNFEYFLQGILGVNKT
jgi:hypothetical protein